MHTLRSLSLAAAMLAVAASPASPASAAEKAFSTNYLVELKRGISFGQFTNGHGVPPIHEFTVRRGSNIVRCVSQYLDKPFQQYYFVFVDNRLTTVCEPPLFDRYMIVPYQGGQREVRKPWKPEEGVEQVMQSKDLAGTALAESIVRRRRLPDKGSGQFPPSFVSLVTPGLERANKAVEAVAQVFDPFKVALGDGLEMVDSKYGNSQHTETLANRNERRCYGSPRHGVNIKVWLMVGFREGKVVEIFSDDFFDTTKISKSSR